jgi:hypothetical protein
MAVAKNLEATHHVEILVEGIDENMKAANERTRSFLSLFMHVPTLLSILPQIGMDEQQRSFILDGTTASRPS